jgi:hypothetical protein
LRGVRTAAAAERSSSPPSEELAATPSDARSAPDWRLLIASIVDACVVGILFAIVIACARIATATPLAETGESGARALALMGLVFAVAYYFWFGGLMAVTAGERVVGLGEAEHPSGERTTLGILSARAFRSATADLRFFAGAGAWLREVVRARPGLQVAPHEGPGLQMADSQMPGLKLIRGVRATSGRGRPAEFAEDLEDSEDDDLTIRMPGPTREPDPDLTLD